MTFEKELKIQTVDEVLTLFTERYGNAFKQKPIDLSEMIYGKIGYRETIKVAKEKGLDVSEYPTELNHLDHLLI